VNCEHTTLARNNFVPQGQRDHSPAFQRRERAGLCAESQRDGRIYASISAVPMGLDSLWPSPGVETPYVFSVAQASRLRVLAPSRCEERSDWQRDAARTRSRDGCATAAHSGVLAKRLLLASFLLAPAHLFACAACGSANPNTEQSSMVDGMNLAILTLGAILTPLLAAFLGFFIYLIRRSEAVEAARKNSAEPAKI